MAAPYSDLQVALVQHADYSGLQIPDYAGLEHYKTAGDNLHGDDLPSPDNKELSRTPAQSASAVLLCQHFGYSLVTAVSKPSSPGPLVRSEASHRSRVLNCCSRI